MIGDLFNNITSEILDNPQTKQEASIPYRMAKLNIGLGMATAVLSLDI